jgi:hypothetical protein
MAVLLLIRVGWSLAAAMVPDARRRVKGRRAQAAIVAQSWPCLGAIFTQK